MSLKEVLEKYKLAQEQAEENLHNVKRSFIESHIQHMKALYKVLDLDEAGLEKRKRLLTESIMAFDVSREEAEKMAEEAIDEVRAEIKANANVKSAKDQVWESRQQRIERLKKEIDDMLDNL